MFWTNGRLMDERLTNDTAPPGTPPLPRLKITGLKVRAAWSRDRVLIRWAPSVHVLVMSQDVISSISE